jgi:hypothetical protein
MYDKNMLWMNTFQCNLILADLPEIYPSNSILVHSDAYMTKYYELL